MTASAIRIVLGFLLAAADYAVPAQSAGQPGGSPAAVGIASSPREGAQSRPQSASYGGTPAELVPYNRSGGPYRHFYLKAPLFRGPGREAPAPEGLETVRIGLLAPLEGTKDDRAGQSLKHGVELAVEEANAAGGYKSLPFALVIKNDRIPWGSSSNALIEFAYADKVWAVIGSIDSNSTHVALRAAFKAEVPIVNVGSTDPTLTETGIPWIIRCTPDDRQTSYRLAEWLFEEKKLSRVAVLRSSDRYGRLGIREFRDAARRLHRPVPMEIQFAPGQQDFSAKLERLAAADAEAVVLWARVEDSARIVRQMRARGMQQLVAGTDRLASPGFLALAGKAAEGVAATMWMNPERTDPDWLAFRRRYQRRFAAAPDAFAAYGYDAANLVIEAVRAQGLNRVRIRDALAAVRTRKGASGVMHFDATSNNVVQPLLAFVRGGKFVVR